MSRFNSPAEVLAAAEQWASVLHRNHVEKGHALNPYCTPGAINDFDRGFNGVPLHSWEVSAEWDYRYQTGAAVRRIVDGQGQA